MARFEWDEAKGLTNHLRHGVSFDEARSAFFDENHMLLFDPDHSNEEDRFLLTGESSQLRVLIVSPCYRQQGQVIRIISARKATTWERKVYMKRGER